MTLPVTSDASREGSQGTGGGGRVEREIAFHFYHFFFVPPLKYKMHISAVHSISNKQQKSVYK